MAVRRDNGQIRELGADLIGKRRERSPMMTLGKSNAKVAIALRKIEPTILTFQCAKVLQNVGLLLPCKPRVSLPTFVNRH